ncbi:MAG TPA: hypothetical protein DCM86_10370, partial [Verrucomicrobiales bacterium]|nr:hypothetical protein [Verrucomicrobiales bacterium]
MEQLEPRLLLSAVPLEALPAAIPSVDHDLVLHADLNTGSPTQDSAAISYSPASQIDDILDGLAPLQASPGPAGEALSPEGVQPPASQTPPPDSAAPTLTLDPASGPTSSTTSASLPDADRGVDSGANEAARAGVTAPDSPLAHDGATPSSGSVASAHGDPGAAPSLVGQLTETLRVANAPPSDLLDVHGVGLISSFLGLFTDAPSGGLASGLPPFTPPAFGPSDSRSLSYLGHRAELSSTNDLTLFATGTIPLSELHPDLLHQAGIRSLVIQGSDATDDTLVVDLAAGEIPMPVTFNGGVGAFDTLRVGAVTGGSYTPGKVFGDGVFTSAGGTRITFTGLEPVILDGSLAAPSVVSGAATPSTTSLAGGTFTFTTPFTGGGADLITIDSPAPGQNRISGTSGGVAFESVTFSNIPHVIIDTGSNDTEGANSDSVKLVSPLVAKGLLDLRITTGAGDDTLDFSQGAAIGVPTLTLDGGTGVDTFVNSSTGLVVLTDASYSAGGKVTQLSGIESARISAGLIDATGFKGTVLALTGAPVWESAGPTGTTGGQTEGLEAQGNPVSGAILTVVINPLNPQQVFIGTTNGGVWKTDNIDATRQVSIAEYEDLLRDRAPDVTAAGTVVAENPAVTPSTLTKGAYLYRISYVNGDLGTESALSRASALPAFNLTADGKSILLSHLPTGPAGTTARNIYRMGPNDQGLYKLAGTIPDNTTTTFVDSTDGVAPRTKTVSYPHWVPLTDAWDSLGITALAFDPSDPSGRTIYAGTGNGSSSNESGPAIGLLKTTDGGVTWRVMGGTDLGMRGLKITAIAFSTPRILASAGFVGSAPAVGPVTATKGSASGGQLTPGEYRYRVTYLNTDTGEESAPSAEIAVTVGLGENQVTLATLPKDASTGATASNRARYIYRKDPGAKAFVLVGVLGNNTDTSFVDKSPRATPVVLVSTLAGVDPAARGGVYRSADGGETWVRSTDTDPLPANAVSGLPPGRVTDLVAVRDPLDPTKPGILFAAHGGDATFANAGIYKSIDQGVTWTKVSGAIPDGIAVGNYDFQAASPARMQFAVQTLDGATRTTRLYLGVVPSVDVGTQQANHLSRVFRSDDLGATWRFVIDSPGSVDTDLGTGTQEFFDVNPGGQGELQGGMVPDPKTGALYISGDRQSSLDADSSVHSSNWIGRIFRIMGDGSVNYLTNINAAAVADQARGDQLVSDNAQPRPIVTGSLAALVSGGGLLSAGAYQYKITFVDDGGTESNPSAVVGGVVTVAANDQIKLTQLPLGPVGTVRRLIYRTKANGATYYLVAALENTAVRPTEYVDGKPDVLAPGGAPGSALGAELKGFAQTASPTGGTAPHADSHMLLFDPSGRLLEADDGGLYRLDTTGNGAWVSLIGDLGNVEVGAVAYDPITHQVLVGTQDTGAQAQQWLGGGLVWRAATQGDGGNQGVGIDGTQIYHYYISNDFSSMARVEFNDRGVQVGAPAYIGRAGVGLNHMLPGDLSPGGFNLWPFVVNGADHKRLLMGYDHLYFSADNGINVTDLTVANPAEDHGSFITALAYGGMNSDGSLAADVIYRARGSSIDVSADNGGAWKGNFDLGGIGATTSVSQITMDPMNWRVAYAVAGSRVFATVDGGTTWRDITGPESGAGALPTQSLKGVALVPVDQPDLGFLLRDGTSFTVSLRGAQTVDDLKRFIEIGSRSPLGVARVTVELLTASADRKIRITDNTTGAGTFTLTAVGTSGAVSDLGLAADAATRVGAVITGRKLGDNFAGATNLNDLKLDATGVSRVGVHRSAADKDVLLVGGTRGIYRVFNPLGDPAMAGKAYPAISEPSRAAITVPIPGDNNDLIFTARQPGDAWSDTTVHFVNRGGTGPATVTWNPFTDSLVFDIRAATTATDILALLNGPDVSGITLTPLAGAGTLAAAEYRYKVSFLDASGTEGNLSVERSVVVAAAGSKVTLGNLPTGPAGTTVRKIYRAEKGSTRFLLVGTVNDNAAAASFVDLGTGAFDPLVSDPSRPDAPNTAASGTVAADGGAGGQLLPGKYRYRLSFITASGVESNASESVSITLSASGHLIALSRLPTGLGDVVARRIYRTAADGSILGLVATLNDNVTTTFTDLGVIASGSPTVYDGARALAPPATATATPEGTDGKLAAGSYFYRFSFLDASGAESNLSFSTPAVTLLAGQHLRLDQIPLGPQGTSARRLYRGLTASGDLLLVATLADNTTTTFTDGTVAVVTRVAPVVTGTVAVDGGLGGQLVAGVYRYKVSFVDRLGFESDRSLSFATTDPAATAPNKPTDEVRIDDNHKINLTALPVSTDSGVVSRRIYRTTADGNTFTLLATINDNTTTTFTDGGLPTATASTGSKTTDVGQLSAGAYRYRVAFVSSQGKETILWSDVGPLSPVVAGHNVTLSNLPLSEVPGTVARRIYRTNAGGATFVLIATLNDNATTTFIDRVADLASADGPLAVLPPTATASSGPAAADAGQLSDGLYQYRITFLSAAGVESLPSASFSVTVTEGHSVTLARIPVGSSGGAAGVVARRLYRTGPNGETFQLVATLNDNTTTTFVDRDSGQGTEPLTRAAGAAFSASLSHADDHLPGVPGSGTVGFIQAQLSGGVTNRTAASAAFAIKGSTNTLVISAVAPGAVGNGVLISIVDVGTGAESVEWDPTQGAAGILLLRIHGATTTAAQVRDLVNQTPDLTIRGLFVAGLTSAPDGTRPLAFVPAVTSGGAENSVLATVTVAGVAFTERTPNLLTQPISITVVAKSSQLRDSFVILPNSAGDPTSILITYRSFGLLNVNDLIAALNANAALSKLFTFTAKSDGTTRLGSFKAGELTGSIAPVSPAAYNSTAAAAVVAAPGENNDLVITARDKGIAYNNIAVIFTNTGAVADPAKVVVTWAPPLSGDNGGMLIFDINAKTTAQNVVDAMALLGTTGAGAVFQVAKTSLDSNKANTGAGVVPVSGILSAGGTDTGAAASVASGVVVIPNDPNDLKITAKSSGDAFNGATSFINTGLAKTAQDVRVSWLPAEHLLEFDIHSSTTAADIVAAMAQAGNAEAAAAFAVALRTPVVVKTAIADRLMPQALNPGTGAGVPRWGRLAVNLPNAILGAMSYTPAFTYRNAAGVTATYGDVLLLGLRGRGVWILQDAARNLAPPPVLEIRGTTGDNVFALRLNPDHLQPLDPWVDVFQLDRPVGEQLLGSYPMAQLDGITLLGGAGNDRLLLDSRLRLPGGVKYDGGEGADSLVLLGSRGDAVLGQSVGTTSGSILIGGGNAAQSPSLSVEFENLQVVQVSIPDAGAENDLARVQSGLQFLAASDKISNAIGSKQLPLIGSGATNVITGGSGSSLSPLSDRGHLVAGGVVAGEGGEEAPAAPGGSAVTSILGRLLGDDLLARIGSSSLSSLEALRQALDDLDGTDGNVKLWQTGGGFLFDVTVARTVDGGTALDLEAFGGALSLKGDIHLSADVALHLVFGADAQGFYLVPTAAGDHALALGNLKVDGSLTATGDIGIISVSLSQATLSFDPSVQLTLDLTEPGAGEVDGKIRISDFSASLGDLIQVNLAGNHGQGASQTPDVVFSTVVSVDSAFGKLDPQQFIFTWSDVSQLSGVTVTGSGVPFIQDKIDSIAQAIENGIGRLHDFSTAFSSGAAFNTELPLINRKLRDLMDVGALLDVGTAVIEYLRDPGDPTHVDDAYHLPTFEGLADVINREVNAALAGAIGNSPLSVRVDLSPADRQLRFDIGLDVTKTFSRDLNFGPTFAALGLDPNSGAKLDVNLGVALDFSFGIDLGTFPPTSSNFFLQLHKAQVTAGIGVTDLSLATSFAGAAVAVSGGRVALDAEVSVGLNDPNNDGKLSFAELTSRSTSLTSLIGITAHASLDASIPLTTLSLAGFDLTRYGTPTVMIEAPDLFVGAPGSFVFNRPRFSIDIFLDNPDVQSNILARLQELTDKLQNRASGSSSFLDDTIPILHKSINDLVGNLSDALDLHSSAQTYFDSFLALDPNTNAPGVNHDPTGAARPDLGGLAGWMMVEAAKRLSSSGGEGPLTLSAGFDLATHEVRFGAKLDYQKVQSYSLDSSSLAADMHLDGSVSFTGVTAVTLTGHVTAGFGIALDLGRMFSAATLPDAVKFTLDPITLSGELSAPDVNFVAGFGGAVSGGVTHGALDVTLSGRLDFVDPNGDGVITLREVRATAFRDLLHLTASASIDASLPLTLTIAGFSPTDYGVPVVTIHGDGFLTYDSNRNGADGRPQAVVVTRPDFTVDIRLTEALMDKILDVTRKFDEKLDSALGSADASLGMTLPVIGKSIGEILGVSSMRGLFALTPVVQSFFDTNPLPTVLGLLDELSRHFKQGTAHGFNPDLPNGLGGNFELQVATALDLRGFLFEGADLRGANFSGSDLEGIDFRGADLRGANLTGANLRGADFTGARLEDAILTGAWAIGTVFKDVKVNVGTNVAGLLFDRSTVWKDGRKDRSSLPLLAWTGAGSARLVGAGATLSGLDLHGFDLSGLDLTGALLSGAKLAGANLRGTNLSGVDLTGADLSHVFLVGANLGNVLTDLSTVFTGAIHDTAWSSGLTRDTTYLLGPLADFSSLAGGIDFSRFDLSGLDLSGVKFGQSILAGTSLAGAKLTGVSFSGISLRGTTLAGATGLNLAGVSSLFGADLHGVGFAAGFNKVLSGVDLRGANLTGLDLSGFDLSRAQLQGANLAKAVGLSSANLKGALKDALTRVTGFAWSADVVDVKPMDVFAPSTDPVFSFSGGFDPASRELKFEIGLNLHPVVNLDFAFDSASLGSAATDLGLAITGSGRLTAGLAIQANAFFGVNLNVLDPNSPSFGKINTALFFGVDALRAGAGVQVAGLNLNVTLGSLSGGVRDGTASVTAGVQVDLTGSSEPDHRFTFATVGSIKAGIGVTGSLAATLPLSLTLPAIGTITNFGTPIVMLSAPKLFAGTVPNVVLNRPSLTLDISLEDKSVQTNLLGLLDGLNNNGLGDPNGLFATQIPLVGKKLSDLVGPVADLLDLRGAAESYFNTPLAGGATHDLVGLINAVVQNVGTKLNGQFGGETSQGPFTMSGGLDLTNHLIRLGFGFNIVKSTSVSLDLNSLLPSGGFDTGSGALKLNAGLEATLLGRFNAGFTVTLNLDKLLSAPLAAVIFHLDSFKASAELHATDISLGVSLGSAAAGVLGGTADVVVTAGLAVTDKSKNGNLSLQEMKASGFKNLITVAASANIDTTLPLTVTVGSSGANAAVHIAKGLLDYSSSRQPAFATPGPALIEILGAVIRIGDITIKGSYSSQPPGPNGESITTIKGPDAKTDPTSLASLDFGGLLVLTATSVTYKSFPRSVTLGGVNYANGLQQVLIDNGSIDLGVVRISGDFDIRRSVGTAGTETLTTVGFSSVTISIRPMDASGNPGAELVSVTGSGSFHYGSTDGFKLDSLVVADFDLLAGRQTAPNTTTSTGLPGAGSPGASTPTSLPTGSPRGPPTTITLGPLVLTNPAIKLTNFGVGFENGGIKLKAKVTIGVETATITGPGNTSVKITDGTDLDKFGIAGSLDVSVTLTKVAQAGPVPVYLPSDLSAGKFTLAVDHLEAAFGSFLTLTADNVLLDPQAGATQEMLSFGQVGAKLTAGPLVLGGGARNFAVLGNGHFLAKDNFSVTLTLGQGQDAGALNTPTWLPLKNLSITLQWPGSSFNTTPEKFFIILDADVASIAGLPGVTIAGGIHGMRIDVAKLAAGEFAIVDLESMDLQVAGTAFGAEISGTLIGGLLKFDAANNLIPATDSSTPVAKRVMFGALQAALEIPGLGGVDFRMGFSDFGPLSLFISSGIPIILEPNSGLAITNLRGGIDFGASMPDPTVYKKDPATGLPTSEIDTRASAFNLRALAIASNPSQTTPDVWLAQLKQQITTLVRNSGGGSLSFEALTHNMLIHAGATLYDAYASTHSFRADVDLTIDITGKILMTGKATFGDSLSLDADFYGDLSKIQSGSAHFLFLMDEPGQPYRTELGGESYYGLLSFGFTNPDTNATLTADQLKAQFLSNRAVTESFIAPSSTTFTLGHETSGDPVSILVNGAAYTGTLSTSTTGHVSTLRLDTVVPAGQSVVVTYLDPLGTSETETLTGAPTRFTLTQPVVAGEAVTVTVSGQAVASTAYRVQDNTLIFRQALAAGAPVVVQYKASAATGADGNPISTDPSAKPASFQIIIAGGAQADVFNNTLFARLEGEVRLTISATRVTVDLRATLEVSFLGVLGLAEGELIIDGANGLKIWGALKIKTSENLSAKLAPYGITLQAQATFVINTTSDVQTIVLHPASPEPPITITAAPQSFRVTASGLARLMVGQQELFRIEGGFDLKIDPTGLSILMAGDLKVGPDPSPLMTFHVTALVFAGVDQGVGGFAGMFTVGLDSKLGPFSVHGDFLIQVNTFGHQVGLGIPTTDPVFPTIRNEQGETVEIPAGEETVTVAAKAASLVLAHAIPDAATVSVVDTTDPQNPVTLHQSTDNGATGDFTLDPSRASITLLKTGDADRRLTVSYNRTATISGGAPRLLGGYDPDGPYFVMRGMGWIDLSLARISGQFYINLTPGRFEINMSGSLLVGPRSYLAAGAFTLVNDPVRGLSAYGGVLGKLDQSGPGGDYPGVYLAGSGIILLNTDSIGHQVTLITPKVGDTAAGLNTFDIQKNTFTFRASVVASFRAGATELFRIEGSLVGSVSTDPVGFTLLISGNLVIGPENHPLLSFDANAVLFTGTLATGESGFAAMIHISLKSSGIPGVKFAGGFVLATNTFGRDVSFDIADRDDASFPVPTIVDQHGNSLETTRTDSASGKTYRRITLLGSARNLDGTLEPPGFYVQILGDGEVSVLDSFRIRGAFSILITATKFQLAVSGSLSLGPLGTVSAAGFLEIGTNGLIGAFQVGYDPGSFGAGVGLGFSATLMFAVNTTGAARTVGLPDGSRLQVDPGVRILVDGTMTFAHVVDASVHLVIQVGPQGFRLDGAATVTLGGGLLTAHLDLHVDLDSGGFRLDTAVSVNATIADVIKLNASGMLHIDTHRGVSQPFYLDLSGSLTVLDIFTFNVSVAVQVGGDFTRPSNAVGILPQTVTLGKGEWAFRCSGSVSFFGLTTIGVSGWVQSNGAFGLFFSGGISMGNHTLGFEAGITALVYYDGLGTFGFEATGGASVYIIGIRIGIDAALRYDSRSGNITLTGTVHFFGSHSHTWTIGRLEVPKPAFLAMDA